MRRQASDPYPLKGGVNIVDAHSLLAWGMVTAGAKNMECLSGNGYRRIDGYERVDGNTAHLSSLATYKRIPFTSGGNSPINAGATVTGSTSGATGRALVHEVTSGSTSDGDAVGNLYIFPLSGTFVSGESLLVGGLDLATASDTAKTQSLADASYKAALRAARNYVRSLCVPPSGSGATLGVFTLEGTHYCFRNNAGGTAAVLHKTTTSGWQAINLGHVIEFTNANASVGEGDTLTQGGVTATIKRIVMQVGTLDSGVNAGRMVITTPSGGSFAAGAASSTGSGSLTLVAASAATTLSPGGRYEIIKHNFLASSDGARFYGCDGVNNGFEFDPVDEVYVPILTGMPDDKPNHVAVHLGRLWFSFPGGSLQWSSAAIDDFFEPYLWSVIIGAGELGAGDEITGIKSLKQDQLAVMCKNSAFVLYGSSFVQNNFARLMDKTGCVEHALDEIAGSTICADAMGTYFLSAAAEYGDFKPNALSRNIQQIIDDKINDIRCTVVSRTKNQYRIYFGDMTGVTATFAGTKLSGWYPFELAHQINCIYAGEDSDGSELIIAGTDDGNVVLIDSGPSFDGEYVTAMVALPYVNLGSPRDFKRFYAVFPEIKTPRPIDVTLYTSFDSGGSPGSAVAPAELGASGSVWGESVWGDAYWGAQIIGTPTFDIDGIGLSMRCVFKHHDDVDDPWSIHSNIIDFKPTRSKK